MCSATYGWLMVFLLGCFFLTSSSFDTTTESIIESASTEKTGPVDSSGCIDSRTENENVVVYDGQCVLVFKNASADTNDQTEIIFTFSAEEEDCDEFEANIKMKNEVTNEEISPITIKFEKGKIMVTNEALSKPIEMTYDRESTKKIFDSAGGDFEGPGIYMNFLWDASKISLYTPEITPIDMGLFQGGMKGLTVLRVKIDKISGTCSLKFSIPGIGGASLDAKIPNQKPADTPTTTVMMAPTTNPTNRSNQTSSTTTSGPTGSTTLTQDQTTTGAPGSGLAPWLIVIIVLVVVLIVLAIVIGVVYYLKKRAKSSEEPSIASGADVEAKTCEEIQETVDVDKTQASEYNSEQPNEDATKSNKIDATPDAEENTK